MILKTLFVIRHNQQQIKNVLFFESVGHLNQQKTSFIKKFDINNVCTVEGYAPLVLDSLPAPDRIFIGGSGGCMDEILAWIVKSVKKTRVVANAVTPESVYKVLNGFKNYDFKDVEILSVGISKGHKAGEKHIMKALNPVYIISGQIG